MPLSPLPFGRSWSCCGHASGNGCATLGRRDRTRQANNCTQTNRLRYAGHARTTRQEMAAFASVANHSRGLARGVSWRVALVPHHHSPSEPRSDLAHSSAPAVGKKFSKHTTQYDDLHIDRNHAYRCTKYIASSFGSAQNPHPRYLSKPTRPVCAPSYLPSDTCPKPSLHASHSVDQKKVRRSPPPLALSTSQCGVGASRTWPRGCMSVLLHAVPQTPARRNIPSSSRQGLLIFGVCETRIFFPPLLVSSSLQLNHDRTPILLLDTPFNPHLLDFTSPQLRHTRLRQLMYSCPLLITI